MYYNERMTKITNKTWHGYDAEASQWFMEPRFQNLEDKEIQAAFVDAFLEGKSQARLMLNGHNREADAPDCLYAAKLVRRPHSDGQRLFMIRVDAATMAPMDVHEMHWNEFEARNEMPSQKGGLGGFFGKVEDKSSVPSVDPSDKMSDILEQVFGAVANWHRNSFGVGPVAPPMGSSNPNDGEELHERFTHWQQARLERTSKRSTSPSSPAPRL